MYNDNNNNNNTVADVDKFHRDGQQSGEKQDVIVRFLSHSAKEVFYDKRKQIVGDNEHLKIRPNLTDGTKQLQPLFNNSSSKLSARHIKVTVTKSFDHFVAVYHLKVIKKFW